MSQLYTTQIDVSIEADSEEEARAEVEQWLRVSEHNADSAISFDMPKYAAWTVSTPDYMKGMSEDEYADWQKSMRQTYEPDDQAHHNH